MPEYVITARAPDGDRFGDEPGPSLFLEVPDDAQELLPSHEIDWKDWFRKVVALCPATPDPSGAERGDLLVFVHGYDNDVRIVLQRQRILRSDLPQKGFRGGLVSFDWPSGNKALAYLEDRHRAKLTAMQLVSDCIRPFASLQAPDCPINVHVLAHSTGAYVIREAFDDADDHRAIAAANWTVSQLVLIAGDVSGASLSAGNASSESLYRHCLRLTNYSNPYDAVLQISNAKRAGLAPRVGRVGLPDDAPPKALDVNCGEYWQQMMATRDPATIIGYPSHSWHVGDPVFTQDLVETLKGDLDRSAFPTRERLVENRFRLVAPAAPPVAVAVVAAAPTAPRRSRRKS
jgi:hypothetical protein